MEKKKIYYIIGAIAILGIGYYLWNKNKSQAKSTEQEAEEETEKVEAEDTKEQSSKTPVKAPIVAKAGATSVSSVKKLTAQELESKLQTACGKKPKLKKNKKKYDKCRADYTAKLKSQGLVAFDGTYEGVVSEGFYSSFENNWDLDI